MIDPRWAMQVLGRGLRLRCPRCGQTPLFRGPFTMAASCAVCELRFEREQGYFVGAIYLNFAATILIVFPGYFALDHLLGPSLGAQLLLWGAFCVLFPLAFFRYSKSLWLAIDHVVDPETPDQRGW